MIHLRSITTEELRVLATSRIPPALAAISAVGALPQAHVALRALEHLRAGKPFEWCATFFVVRRLDRVVVGSCGFQDVPAEGCVEIGCTIAPGYRGEGLATAAVEELLRLAFAGEAPSASEAECVARTVNEVVALMGSENRPAERVLEKLGFVAGPTVVDDEGDTLVRWVRHRAAVVPVLERE